MENIENLTNIIMSCGGTVVMAVLFIIFLFYDRKDRQVREETEKEERKEEKANNAQLLKELAKSTNNVAESLNLLKISTDNNTNEFRQHDERAIKQFGHINEYLIKIEEKLSK